MYKSLFISLILFGTMFNYAYADTNILPELVRANGKQQEKAKDNKGNTILVTPHYKNYNERNQNISEKVVAIYDKRSPAYGYKYILYSPVGNYVGHHRVMQRSLNGYGYDPIPEGGEGSSVPCFKTIEEAKHYYYPQWY